MDARKKHHLVRLLLLGPAIVIGLTGGAYLVVCNSKGYEVAAEFVRNDQKLHEQLGTVKSTRLSALSGMNYRSVGEEGDLRFTIVATGIRNDGCVSMRLHKNSDVWSVYSAKLALLDQSRVLPMCPE